jgi:hypothetical protein
MRLGFHAIVFAFGVPTGYDAESVIPVHNMKDHLSNCGRMYGLLQLQKKFGEEW